MKILHIITTIERGGAERQLLLLSKLQVTHRNTVTVVPLKHRPRLENEFIDSGVMVNKHILGRNVIVQILALLRFIRNEKFDIVHAHLPRAEFIGAVLSLCVNVKFVITKHNSEPFWPGVCPSISSSLGRAVYRRASRVIVISKAVIAELAKNSEIVGPSKIRLVYYGYECGLIMDRRTRTRSCDLVLRICTVSRLVPQKNLENFLRACSIIKEKGVSISVKVVGEGVLRNELISLAHSLGLETSIEWLGGNLSDPFESIMDSDVFVLSSFYEGFGLVLLEALATDLTVVASNTSAIPEVLGEDYPLMFDPSNPHEIAQRILESSAPNIRQLIAEHRNQTLNRFSAKIMFSSVDAIYQELLQCRRGL